VKILALGTVLAVAGIGLTLDRRTDGPHRIRVVATGLVPASTTLPSTTSLVPSTLVPSLGPTTTTQSSPSSTTPVATISIQTVGPVAPTTLFPSTSSSSVAPTTTSTASAPSSTAPVSAAVTGTSIEPSATQNTAIESTVAGAEVAYEAMGSPAPLPGSTMSQAAVARTFAGLPKMNDDRTVAPHAFLDSTGRHAYLSPSELATTVSNDQVVLTHFYGPTLEQRYLTVSTNVADAETSGQDLFGGGGATILEYQSVAVTGTTATVTATVAQWSTIGSVNATTGAVTWQTNQANVRVDETLTDGTTGWLVTARTWQYLPGQGP
jgi:hypothetical protein